MKQKIGLGIILLFAVLQLFNPEKTQYEKPTKNDFFEYETGNEEAMLLVQKICYDCHSKQVKYPWYASISPVSLWIQDHIEHGSEHLNFSKWGEYSTEKRAHKAEEAVEELEEGEMPLESYTFIHREANLSDEEKESLISFFAAIENKYTE